MSIFKSSPPSGGEAIKGHEPLVPFDCLDVTAGKPVFTYLR